jgi:hypothetical protein
LFYEKHNIISCIGGSLFGNPDCRMHNIDTTTSDTCADSSDNPSHFSGLHPAPDGWFASRNDEPEQHT